MKHVYISLIIGVLLFAKVSYAIVGYDKSTIEADSPVYYNTVALVKKKQGQLKVFCSASIASSRAVYTAKHCVEAVEGLEIFVYFGDNTNEIDPLLLRKVANRHKYNSVDLEVSFPSFDFAILEIEGEIPVILEGSQNKPKFSPIPVLTNSDQVKESSEYLVAGFGISETHPKFVHGFKRRVSSQVKSYVANSQFVSLLILQGQKGEGTCHGDSGGPLYAKFEGAWYLAGVASGFDVGLTPGGYKVVDIKNNEKSPDCYGGESVYTFVGDYVNWASRVTDSILPVSEESLVVSPGLSEVNSSESISPQTFLDWCEGTNYLNPAWETIRQMMYFAADAKSKYSSEDVLSSCSVAHEVLNSMKDIEFKDGDFFNDLSPLASLESLESLAFLDTQIPDLESLINLGPLKKIKLKGLGLKDLQSVPGLLQLRSLIKLDLTNNRISDISDLSVFSSLQDLRLGKNKIRDIGSLQSLENLNVIEIYGNQIHDISPLLEMSGLKEILAANNLISTPAKKANWPDLELAIFSNNKLKNLSFLKDSNKIKRLKVNGNLLPVEAN